MVCVDTFIDLPKEAFTQNSIKNYIFTGNTILWTCTEGENRRVTESRVQLVSTAKIQGCS